MRFGLREMNDSSADEQVCLSERRGRDLYPFSLLVREPMVFSAGLDMEM